MTAGAEAEQVHLQAAAAAAAALNPEEAGKPHYQALVSHQQLLHSHSVRNTARIVAATAQATP